MSEIAGLLRNVERSYFRAVNRVVEPAVRAGCGSPGLLPTGLIVLETEGRRTGRRHRTPVVASLIGGHVLVSTARGAHSDWVRNLAEAGEARYWLGGQAHVGRAVVYAPAREPPSDDQLPASLRFLHGTLTRLARDFGWGVALIAGAGS